MDRFTLDPLAVTMRGVSAALLLICFTAAGAQTPGRPSHEGGFGGWSPVGSWAVLLLPLSNGSYVRTAVTREPPWGPAGYSMAFVLSLAATHFYLYHDDPAIPTPRELVLAVDDQPIARLTVIQDQPPDSQGESKHLIVADMPGNLLVRKVVPPLLAGQALTVTAGKHRFKTSVSGFRSVMQDIVDCAHRVAAITGRRS